MLGHSKNKKILNMPASRDSFYNVLPELALIAIIVMSLGSAAGVLGQLVAHGITSPKFFSTLVAQGTLISLMIAAWFILKILFIERLVITKDTIIHRGVRLEGRPETVYRTEDLEFILWVREKKELGPQYHELYLASTGPAIYLLMGRDSALLGKWRMKRFVRQLAESTGLPVHIKTYRLTWDSDGESEKRELIHEKIEKWGFLPRTSTFSLSGGRRRKNRRTEKR